MNIIDILSIISILGILFGALIVYIIIEIYNVLKENKKTHEEEKKIKHKDAIDAEYKEID